MSDEAEPRGMPPATGVFLAAIVVAYVALALREGNIDISTRIIAEFGGIMPLQWLGEEYWRLLSYGFLHFGLMHLAVNSVCLLAWGIPLERLLGSFRLVLLYLGSIVLAGAGSIALHSEPFVSAGASGGVSGLLGALFLLWITGRLSLPASFFAINIGLNVAIPFFAPGIDWQAHLAGFAAGMAIMALLIALRRRRGEARAP